jgi:hypothetical protein
LAAAPAAPDSVITLTGPHEVVRFSAIAQFWGVSISSFDTDFSFRDSVPMATPIRSSFFIKS